MSLGCFIPKFLTLINIRFAGATIMSVVYGLDITDTKDRYLDVAEKSISHLAQAGMPGAFLVDMLPWCEFVSGPGLFSLFNDDIISWLKVKYIPSWVPGARFQHVAKEWRQTAVDVKEVPFEAVTRAFVSHSI